MLIAADIGNTNIVIGFFKDGNFLFSRRLHTGPPQSVDEYEMLLRGMLSHLIKTSILQKVELWLRWYQN